MIDAEDAGYTCTLSASSLAKAIEELYEDPKQRLGAVQTLRQWIKEQRHFNCRTDTDFLLQVLRTAKFSQLRAREIVETILTFRTKFPQYLVSIDSHDPGILIYIERGTCIPFPKRDKEGRCVWLVRLGLVDLNDSRFTETNEVRASMALDALLKKNDEDIIVNGELLIFDMTGLTPKHVRRMTIESDKNVHYIYQDCMLGRMKGIYFYNGGAFFEILMNFIKPFIKKKYLERIHVHSTMESLYKDIPMELWPDEYLPDDYNGPSAGPIANIAENIKKRLMDQEFRVHLLDYTSERYQLDETVPKPTDVPHESFRKLDVD